MDKQQITITDSNMKLTPSDLYLSSFLMVVIVWLYTMVFGWVGKRLYTSFDNSPSLSNLRSYKFQLVMLVTTALIGLVALFLFNNLSQPLILNLCKEMGIPVGECQGTLASNTLLNGLRAAILGTVFVYLIKNYFKPGLNMDNNEHAGTVIRIYPYFAMVLGIVVILFTQSQKMETNLSLTYMILGLVMMIFLNHNFQKF